MYPNMQKRCIAVGGGGGSAHAARIPISRFAGLTTRDIVFAQIMRTTGLSDVREALSEPRKHRYDEHTHLTASPSLSILFNPRYGYYPS